MNRRTPLAAGLALIALALGQAPAAAAEELPIFDTHMHYSREAWGPYAPGRIMDILDTAGVARAPRKRQAEAAVRATSECLANMRHALRTALNAIIRLSDMMRR